MDQKKLKVNIPHSDRKRVVIIGGGFAGIELAKQLKNLDLQVILIDKNNYHTFQPLLYQVATAGLEPDSIAYPIRKIFKKQENIFFRMATVEKIIPESNKLETSIGEVFYDFLVIATGSDTNYFGNANVEHYSMSLKSVVEALDLRSLLLQNFERALLATDKAEQESFMNVVVVGGGPTGVELAGALAELRKNILPADYPELDLSRMKIHLIEASPMLLGTFSPKSSAKTREFLENMGVNVMLSTMVEDYDGESVKIPGKALSSKTLIWAAGVSGAPVDGLKVESVNRGRRYVVDKFNKVDGYQNVYAIGDVAAMITEEYPKGHPMVAPVAVQQAENLGNNMRAVLAGKRDDMKPFIYNDKGSMATIGRNKAIAEIGKMRTTGFIAWVMWMFVHLFMLIGFRNKVVVFVNWLWNYLLYERGIRLIIRPYTRHSEDIYQMRKAG